MASEHTDQIGQNVAQVEAAIRAACVGAGRERETVTLVGISKTHPVESVLAAMRAGVQHFGENRVEEANVKIPTVNAAGLGRPVWHMIGHIQSRKTKALFVEGAPLFDWVDSLDSVKLAQRLSQQAAAHGATLSVLLQMNVSGEASKEGFMAQRWADDAGVRAQLWDEVRAILALPGLQVKGLMTIAPWVEDAEVVRPVFASLRHLRDALAADLGVSLPHLSMGMSDDFAVAIEEGSTLIRIGRAIFGERVY